MKINIAGIECIVYLQNFRNNKLPILLIKDYQLTKEDAKKHIDTIISGITEIVEVMAITDKRFEKYSIALSFLNILKLFLQTGNPSKLDDIRLASGMAQIAIDVIKEIALLEVADFTERSAIKAASLAAKKFIDFMRDNM